MISLLAVAAAVTLTWPPSASPDVAEYRMYWGSTSGLYTNCVSTGTNLTLVLTNLVAERTYYFAATAVNWRGLESAFSKELQFTVSRPPDSGVARDVTVQIWWKPPSGSWVPFTNFIAQPRTFYRTKGAFRYVQGASRMHVLESKDFKTWTTNFSHRISWYDQDKEVKLVPAR